MEIVPLKTKLYPEWNKFCLNSNDAWFWHTTDWIDYLLAYGVKKQSHSLSFFIKDGPTVFAICPLVVSQNESRKEFACKGFPIDSPALVNNLSKKRHLKILKLAFAHIDKLALKHRVKKALFKISPETKNFLYQKTLKFNFLNMFDFIDASSMTQILNLKKPKAQLWREIKKKQRHEIKKSIKNFKVKIFNNKNYSPEIMKQYRKLHQKASGRQTRSVKTFRLMFDWIKKKEAILLRSTYKEKAVGFILLNIYKNAAYYHSACNDPEFKKKSISHSLQWEAIKWLKRSGFEFYNIGEQKISPQIYSLPNKKEKNISYFKRSFGGETFPFFIGEKYYDDNYFLKIYNEKVNKYAKALKTNLKTRRSK